MMLTNSNQPSRVPLAEALKTAPAQECYVYKLSIPAAGTNTYIGFTSQPPASRLEQHLEAARTDSTLPVHRALRKYGFLNEFEVIGEYPNEILALVSEIANIQKFDTFENGLNSTIGGEGNAFAVVQDTNHLGEQIFFVENRAIATQERLLIDRYKIALLQDKERRISEHYANNLSRLGLAPEQLQLLKQQFRTCFTSIPLRTLKAKSSSPVTRNDPRLQKISHVPADQISYIARGIKYRELIAKKAKMFRLLIDDAKRLKSRSESHH